MVGKNTCGGHWVSWLLLLVGGLNWGLIGAFDWNLIEAVFGTWPVVVDVVYVLIGISAVLILIKDSCKMCTVGGKRK